MLQIIQCNIKKLPADSNHTKIKALRISLIPSYESLTFETFWYICISIYCISIYRIFTVIFALQVSAGIDEIHNIWVPKEIQTLFQTHKSVHKNNIVKKDLKRLKMF